MTTNWNPTRADRHVTSALMPAMRGSVAETFKWRDRHGVRHAPADMETRHLFFTLRMIWNNTMPASCRLPGNLYSFGPSYTRAYMLQAIRAITVELTKRTDMQRDWQYQLQQMIRWLATPQVGATAQELLS